ncbi:MAG: hypothetical protein ABR574_07755 [Cryomorphaceae bacterium]|nr:DUF3592 domain-containing protein [Flavobacteriales bacterium]
MYFALIIGLVIIFFGIRMHRKKKERAKTGVSAKAIVLDHREGDIAGRVIYFPVIEIKEGAHQSHKVVLNEGTNFVKGIGKEITVFYPKDDPESAHEHTKGIGMGSIILILVGSFFALFALVVISFDYLWDYLTKG